MITLHIDEQRGWRGGEQQAFYLMEGLLRNGHEVIAAGRLGSVFLQRARAAGIETFAAPFRGEWDLWTAWRLARLVRKRGVDIIHGHTGHAHAYAVYARLLARRGTVIAARRVDFAPRNNFFTRWKYRQADHFIAVSDCIGDVLRAYGVPGQRVSVVRSAQDPARFETAPLTRDALGLAPDARVIVCVAALVGHKDHRTLLNAMPRVLEAEPRSHLLLVGEGELRPRLEAQAQELGIAANVHFLGQRNDVPAVLRAADVFVLSSKMEGLGSAVLEAMFCGAPVAACAAGGIPESVRHEETGLLAPPEEPEPLAEAVLRLLHDRELAARLAENALRRVHAECTAEQMVQKTLNIYNRCKSAHGDRAPRPRETGQGDQK